MAVWNRCGFVRSQVMGEAAERLAVELRSGAALGNYKSPCRSVCRRRMRRSLLPRQERERPDHRKVFIVEVRVKGRRRARKARPAWGAP